MIMHCFTMDVEGFCESMAESFPVSPTLLGTRAEDAEIARNTDETLAFLEEQHVQGTFFILGTIAQRLPALVKRIADCGHEIASHSLKHLRLYGLSRPDAREAIFSSRKLLEDAAGAPVRGFRAPDFSINGQTRYLLDLIQEAGYEYDSSLYPIRGHDVYGMPDTPRWPHRLPNGLREFPLSTFRIGGISIPALGGGYFRLYPLSLTRQILRGIEKSGHPAMFYIHPYELGSQCPKISHMSFSRTFRHYVNRTRTRGRFAKLFAQFKFGRVAQVLHACGLLD
jgi:polysaccharide deacetylase family protein (PEP-CTERM system associated)